MLRSFFRRRVEFRRDPEIKSIKADALAEIIPDWIDDIRRRTNDRTAMTHRYAVAPFVIWLEGHLADYNGELSPGALLDFHSWLRNDYRTTHGKPAAHNGQSSCLKRLRSFFRWCFETGRADMDISAWVPKQSDRPKRSRLLSESSLLRLFDAAGQGRHPVRDQAIIGLFAGTGARSIEVFHARKENIQLQADKSGAVHFEITKGNTPRVSVFGRHTGQLLERWIDFSGGWDRGGMLWSPGLAQPKMLYEVVCRSADRAGLGLLGPHDIRKLFCSHWYRAFPHDDARAQYFLGLQVGHSGRGVTQVHYVNCTADDIMPFYVSPIETPTFANFIDAIL